MMYRLKHHQDKPNNKRVCCNAYTYTYTYTHAFDKKT